ncbi:MAG: hypothetical protein WC787_02400 [Patescibacteria group bacterium]|jgi:hypothetical protein
MLKNPFLNAGAAAAYIILLVLLISSFVDKPGENSLVVPMAMISLFTLSAGVMGYLFLAQPIQLYLAGEKKKAVTFFLHTLAVFGGITAVLLGIVISITR